jgi:hypothetical protein
MYGRYLAACYKTGRRMVTRIKVSFYLRLLSLSIP